MFILSDRFTLKKRSHSWELIEKVSSNHKWTKDGFVDIQRWYPTMEMVFLRIFEVEIEDTGGDLSNLKLCLENSLKEVKRIAKVMEDACG